MAKSKRTKKADVVDVVDAEVVENVEVSEDGDVQVDEAIEPDTNDDQLDSEVSDDADGETPEPEVVEQDVVAPEVQPVVVKKGGFFPMVLGGVVAAGLGFVAGKGDFVPNEVLPEFLKSEETVSQGDLTAIGDVVDGLKSDVEGIAASVPEIQESVTSMGATVEKIGVDLEATKTEMTDKLAELTATATGIGSEASPDVSALRKLIEAQDAKIEELSKQAADQLAAAEQTVAAIEADAIKEAKQAEARSALARVQAALDTGSDFGAALSDLQSATDIEVPAGLIEASQTGVPALATLVDDFPDAARSALAAARAAGTDGETNAGGKLAAFIARQTGARSVEPREGDDPDAVLSRMEAAVKAGALNDALAEADALPESARVELADWLKLAKTRLDALGAADALSSALKSN